MGEYKISQSDPNYDRIANYIDYLFSGAPFKNFLFQSANNSRNLNIVVAPELSGSIETSTYVLYLMFKRWSVC